MLIFSNIKINLGLYVTGKRPDGYHNIESVFYPVKGYFDCIEVLPSDEFRLTILGRKIPCKTEENIIYKAYSKLNGLFQLSPVEIVVVKNIPAGSGLGGGSSNGSFTLALLNKYFNLHLSQKELQSLALELGSDCPFFIQNKPIHVNGRGDLLKPVSLNLSGYHITIITPGVHVSTAKAYSLVRPSIPGISIRKIITLPVNEWNGLLENDFEKEVFKEFPQIAALKKTLYKAGALFALMSGSGSTVFALSEIPLQNLKIPVGAKAWQGIL